jgi:hypothetical protein
MTQEIMEHTLRNGDEVELARFLSDSPLKFGRKKAFYFLFFSMDGTIAIYGPRWNSSARKPT